MQWVLVGRMVDAGNPNVPPNKALRPTPRAASRPDDLDTGPIASDRQPVPAANLGECDAHRGSARTTDCRRHTGRAIATPARGSDDNVQVQVRNVTARRPHGGRPCRSHWRRAHGGGTSRRGCNHRHRLATPGGGTVFFPAGTYLCGSTITLPGGVHLVGSGVGGDIFSATDTELPYRGTVLRLKSASNVDLIKTVNFDGLTGSVKAAAYQTPGRFGLHNLALDGNKAGNRSGIPLRIFGKAYEIDHVVIQNGAAGGVYSEYGGGGYEMEARLTNFHITDNAGDGLVWKGPHDSLFVNGVVARNSGYNGINIVMGSCVGGEQFTNVQVWGSHSQAWVLGTQNASFTNCIADGAGVQVTGSGNCWIGGSILGTKTAGEVAITIGDGTTRTVSGNQFITRVYNYAKPAPLLRVLLNTTSFRNRWQISANMGGNIRYYTQGKSTLASSITLPASAIAVADASSFPPSGGTL